MESATNGTSKYLISFAWQEGDHRLYGAVQKEFEGERRNQIKRVQINNLLNFFNILVQ